jgi:hypothetical protein
MPETKRKSEFENGAVASPWLVTVMLVLFASLYFFLHRHGLGAAWLEDLPIYKSAAHAFLAGQDPYSVIWFGLHFVYPPIVLYLFAFLARLMPGESEWTLVVCIHFACMLATPFVLARSFFRAKWMTALFAFFIWFVETDFTAVRALFSANVAPTLYLAALLAAAPGFSKNRWGWFYLVVLLAASVKVTFLILLLLPILGGRRQWLGSIAIGVAVAGVNAFQMVRVPALYAGYKNALVQQVSAQKLYGYGVFGTIAEIEQKLHPSVHAAYAIHALFAVTFLAFLFWLKQRGAASFAATSDTTYLRADQNIWHALLLMAVIVINPRVLHYDIYLALFAAFVVLALAIKLTGWKLVALATVMNLPSLIVLPHVQAWYLPQTYSLCLVLLAIAVGVRQLARETGLEPVAAPARTVESPLAASMR